VITLGIDIGSTSIKALLFNADEKKVLSMYARNLDSRVRAAPAHYFEEDPIRVRDLTFEAIREATQYAKSQGKSIERIAFTGQMHGGLFVDKDLQPLTNFVTWQDKRCDEVSDSGKKLIEEIRESVPTKTWDSTGGPIFTGFLGATVHWFIKHDRVPANAFKIFGIYDWLASELCGKAVTDPSSAAAWGIYSIESMEWQKDILRALRIKEAWLPDVVETGGLIGNVSNKFLNQLGLADGTKVVSGMGDTQASFIGSGCGPNEVLVNFGTGSQAMWQRESFARFKDTDTRYLPLGKYLVTVPTLSGGQAYALLADLIQDIVRKFSGVEVDRDKVFETMNRIAQEADDLDSLKVIPYFNGSRTKGESLRASISGLSRENFRIDSLARATLGGMVDEIAAPYLAIPQNERPHSGIVGSGNGIRHNPALRSIAESKFGLPIRLSACKEEAAFGAAMAAAGNLA